MCCKSTSRKTGHWCGGPELQEEDSKPINCQKQTGVPDRIWEVTSDFLLGSRTSLQPVHQKYGKEPTVKGIYLVTFTAIFTACASSFSHFQKSSTGCVALTQILTR